MTVKCKMCGKDFTTLPSIVKSGHGKFCSKKCLNLYRKHNSSGINNPHWKGGLIERECEYCHKKFKVPKARLNHSPAKFCSPKCMGLGKKRDGKDNPNWKGGLEKRVCAVCGIDFMPTRGQVRNGSGNFCSKGCAHKSREHKIEKVCVVCGVVFYTNKFFDKMGKKRFCSRKCKGVWSSKNLRGENAPSWKGGVPPSIERIRGCVKYKKWRSNVFLRDKFTCQKCGDKTGDNLEAHHIKSFLKLITELKDYLPLFPIGEAAILYPPLWDISNGITLCDKCHKKTHKKRK